MTLPVFLLVLCLILRQVFSKRQTLLPLPGRTFRVSTTLSEMSSTGTPTRVLPLIEKTEGMGGDGEPGRWGIQVRRGVKVGCGEVQVSVLSHVSSREVDPRPVGGGGKRVHLLGQNRDPEVPYPE